MGGFKRPWSLARLKRGLSTNWRLVNPLPRENWERRLVHKSAREAQKERLLDLPQQRWKLLTDFFSHFSSLEAMSCFKLLALAEVMSGQVLVLTFRFARPYCKPHSLSISISLLLIELPLQSVLCYFAWQYLWTDIYCSGILRLIFYLSLSFRSRQWIEQTFYSFVNYVSRWHQICSLLWSIDLGSQFFIITEHRASVLYIKTFSRPLTCNYSLLESLALLKVICRPISS